MRTMDIRLCSICSIHAHTGLMGLPSNGNGKHSNLALSSPVSRPWSRIQLMTAMTKVIQSDGNLVPAVTLMAEQQLTSSGKNRFIFTDVPA
ncbi:hypothetical protein Ancab_002075 [Ancistrocladus abbreviatus]